MGIKINLLLLSMSIWSFMGYGQSRNVENRANERGLLLNQVIEVSGRHRNYHVFVPNHPKDAPIVVLLHGNRSSHSKLLGLNKGRAPYKIWLDIAERDNMIVVVPNGVRGSEKHRGWNDCRSDAKTNPRLDDVHFIGSLIDEIVNTYGANAAQVYAVGTSNGGHMALRLAQEIPEKLAAIGAVVAANPVNSKCKASDIPISVIFINGTSDPILPYNGGQMASNRGAVHSAEHTLKYWTERNKTDAIPVVLHVTDSEAFDKSTIQKRTYLNGADNTEVVFYTVNNGGHTEPSKSERYRRFFATIVGNQNADIEMAEEVWEFFRTKSK